MKASSISAVLAAVLCASAAHGQAAPGAGAVPPSVVSSQAQPGATLDGVVASARRTFRDLDASGDGRLDGADAKLHEGAAGANLRAGVATRIMGSDLDGDGAVTEAELRAKRRYDQRTHEARDAMAQREAQVEDEVRRLVAADADKDGRVTWNEAAQTALANPSAAERLSHGQPANIREILAYAGKEQTALTASDFEDLAIKLFRGFDADGNGTISQDEFGAIRRQAEERQRAEAETLRLRRVAEARAGCELPKPSDAAKVVLLSAYGSDALSTTAIGSQDVGTGTGSITVEPGDEPLYVVVVAYRPVIWRFSGAVDRVERVAMAAHVTGPNSSRPDARPLAGATGLPAEKVTFLPRPGCLDVFTETPSGKAATTTAIVRRETGKEPVVAGRSQVSGFSVPSAEVRTTGRPDRPMLVISKPAGTLRVEGGANVVIEAGASDVASEVARFYPGGIVEIDPATVVASETPTRYEVLPNQAGLVQLLQRGALARNRGGEFLIKQKIRFPAELHGAHSARFLLLRGVPAPDGDPGHSCVISEETGQPIGRSGLTC